MVVLKNGRLCRVTAVSFYVITSLRAERNELNIFMNTFIVRYLTSIAVA
jgi:hypothetical protein